MPAGAEPTTTTRISQRRVSAWCHPRGPLVFFPASPTQQRSRISPSAMERRNCDQPGRQAALQ